MAQCRATIYVRDTYRQTGRGRSGFELHYARRQCSRPAQEGSDYCWQHPWAKTRLAYSHR